MAADCKVWWRRDDGLGPLKGLFMLQDMKTVEPIGWIQTVATVCGKYFAVRA